MQDHTNNEVWGTDGMQLIQRREGGKGVALTLIKAGAHPPPPTAQLPHRTLHLTPSTYAPRTHAGDGPTLTGEGPPVSPRNVSPAHVQADTPGPTTSCPCQIAVLAEQSGGSHPRIFFLRGRAICLCKLMAHGGLDWRARSNISKSQFCLAS